MGMFEKDKMYGGERLDKWAEPGDRFVLWGVVEFIEDVPTSIGDGTKVILEVSSLDAPDNKTRVGTFASAIVEKSRDAEPSDFPAVVMLETVESKQYDTDALVLSFVEPFTGSGTEAA